MNVAEHGLIFRGYLMPHLLSGRKTRTMRTVARHNSTVGVFCENRSYAMPSAEKWGRLDFSNIVNPGDFCQSGGLHIKRTDLRQYECIRPRIQPGDCIWSRETWQAIHVSIDPETGYGDDIQAAPHIPVGDENGHWSLVYAATDPQAKDHKDDRGFAWRSPLHQPRWAARFVSPPIVRVFPQYPRDLTDAECVAEGAEGSPTETPREAFARIWRDINGQDIEEAPICWVYGWADDDGRAG